jgi:hypothetical protein
MRENDVSPFALVDIGHSPALDFQGLLSSERWFCAIGHCFPPLEQGARVPEGGGRVVPVIEGRLRVP